MQLRLACVGRPLGKDTVHSLHLTRSAEKQLDRMPIKDALRVAKALRRLCDWPAAELECQASRG